MLNSFILRSCSTLLALALPLLAHASLPLSTNVPGGVAVVPLGKVVSNEATPRSWLGTQPLLVTADHDEWFAIVGLSLATQPGNHTLRVQFGDVSKTQDFEVQPKDYPEQRIMLKDKGKVQLSPENLTRAKREIAQIIKLKHHWHATPDTDLAFVLPADGPLTGHFGVRRFFNGQPRAPHAGLDMAVDIGTPVRASGRGTVLAVGDYFFNGKSVFIDHGNGLITLYCHLDRIDVQAGEAVNKGQHIALSGKSGRATGPHVHWSVVLNGTMVDPEAFIAAPQ